MTSVSRNTSGVQNNPLQGITDRLKETPAQEIKPKDFVPLPGMKIEDNPQFNLVMTAEVDPNMMRFPDEPNATPKTYKSSLKAYADPGDDTPGLASQEVLRQKLGVDDKWKGAEAIKGLSDQLAPTGVGGAQYADVLRDLAKIKERHGLATANKVAKTLQDFLSRNQPDDGVNAKQLVRNALGDMAYPSNIDQANKGTCAATAVQMKWALEKPTTYAQALTQLGEGKTYTTTGGDPLPPNDTWKDDTNDNRNFSARIMQNALMDLGNNVGVDQTYNSKADKNESFWNDYSGLYSDDTNYALGEVMGADYQVDNMYSGSSLYGYVEDEVARGRSAVISFKGHAVLVTGIDKKNDQVIINTWGEQYTMPVDDFKKYVQSAISIDDWGWDDKQTPANTVTEVTH